MVDGQSVWATSHGGHGMMGEVMVGRVVGVGHFAQCPWDW